MTKEELRKEATSTVEWESTPMIDRPLFVLAYIVGAEPREKRISELEKENNRLSRKCECLTKGNESLIDIANDVERLEKENRELKTVKIPQLERKIASIRGANSVDCKKLNARTEQVERLKKENTELKIQNTNANLKGLEMQIAKDSHRDRARKAHEQLTKAKAIITKLVEGIRIISDPKICLTDVDTFVSEAEQFLNEVE